MVEHGTPDGAIRRRQGAESEQIVEQRVIGGAKRRVVVGPPIVDEDADRFERFDAVPPHIWQIKRNAGIERRFARVAPRLGEAPAAVEVGRERGDYADRSAGRGQPERERKSPRLNSSHECTIRKTDTAGKKKKTK